MNTPCKITTELSASDSSVTLLLNGKLSEDALADLEQTITSARSSHRTIYIDLSEVTLVDRKAVQYLTEWRVRDIRLINCPTYLRRWIPQVSDEI